MTAEDQAQCAAILALDKIQQESYAIIVKFLNEGGTILANEEKTNED